MSVFADMRQYIIGRTLQEGQLGCWLWTGQTDKHGYGQFRRSAKGRWNKAHRESFLAFSGQIPAGLHVLHRCDVPRCVNPTHLYLGTPKDNVRDMQERGRANYVGAPKTHCKRGHELTPENRLGKRGKDCKACHAIRQRAYREADHSLV